jgi:hypothetical protein
MSVLALRRLSAVALLGLGLAGPAGCAADSDACKGRSETCLSLTLLGEDGVGQIDQLSVMVMRQPKPQAPMMPLGEPRPLPVKVAVLWPDGPGTVSVRSYLNGQLNGVSAELSLDLRNGAHDQRKLSLYPPLSGSGLGDLASGPRDMAHPPADMATPPDLTAPPPDLTAPPPDLTAPLPDLTAPTD